MTKKPANERPETRRVHVGRAAGDDVIETSLQADRLEVHRGSRLEAEFLVEARREVGTLVLFTVVHDDALGSRLHRPDVVQELEAVRVAENPSILSRSILIDKVRSCPRS